MCQRILKMNKMNCCLRSFANKLKQVLPQTDTNSEIDTDK